MLAVVDQFAPDTDRPGQNMANKKIAAKPTQHPGIGLPWLPPRTPRYQCYEMPSLKRSGIVGEGQCLQSLVQINPNVKADATVGGDIDGILKQFPYPPAFCHWRVILRPVLYPRQYIPDSTQLAIFVLFRIRILGWGVSLLFNQPRVFPPWGLFPDLQNLNSVLPVIAEVKDVEKPLPLVKPQRVNAGATSISARAFVRVR